MLNFNQTKIWGLVSFGISLFFVIVLVLLWKLGTEYESRKEQQLTGILTIDNCEKWQPDIEDCYQLAEECEILAKDPLTPLPNKCDDVQTWLKTNWFSLPKKNDNAIQIPTGIFIPIPQICLSS